MKLSLQKLLLSSALLLSAAFACQAADDAKPVNLLKSSGDLTAPAWKSFARNATVVKSDEKDPSGKQEAFRVTIEKGGFLGQVLREAVPGNAYAFSAWLKSANGQPLTLNIAGENNPPKAVASFKPFDLTGEWQRVYLVFPCPQEANANFRFSFRDGDILVWHPQVEDVTGKTPAEPGEYKEN